METGEQGKAAKPGDARGAGRGCLAEEAGGQGKSGGVEEADPGRGCQVGGGCRWQGNDGEVKIVRWKKFQNN